jgi:hypothetical protein
MVTSALEGGLFGGGVVTAMRLARRQLAETTGPTAAPPTPS